MQFYHKMILWAPRILSIGFICFLTLFSFDVFELDLIWHQLLWAFVLHNIPTIILMIILVFSWKHLWLGAICFTLAGISYAIWMLLLEGLSAILAILSLGVPAIIIGVLFFVGYQKKLKNH